MLKFKMLKFLEFNVFCECHFFILFLGPLIGLHRLVKFFFERGSDFIWSGSFSVVVDLKKTSMKF